MRKKNLVSKQNGLSYRACEIRSIGIAKISGFSLLLFLTLFLSSCSTLKKKQETLYGYSIYKEKLPNGLTLLLVQDSSVPVVNVQSWFKVGSLSEKKGATGIAHLFEHLMFKGTPRVPKNAFLHFIESKGGSVNAYTENDSTVYHETIASKHLEAILDLESDRLQNLILSKEVLDAERKVVQEERRQRVESNFQAMQFEELSKVAYPSDHPYSWPVIGYQTDLEKLSVEQIKKFFSDYYQPSNLILTIAGDIDIPETVKWVHHYYGSIQGKAVAPVVLPKTEHKIRNTPIVLKKPVKSETVLLGYFATSMYDADSPKLAMLSSLLFGMQSSLFNRVLVRQKKIALDIDSQSAFEPNPYLFLLEMQMKKGVSAKQGLKELDLLLANVISGEIKITEEELLRVKNQLTFQTIDQTKSAQGVANWMAFGEFFFGDVNYVYKLIESFYQIKLEELHAVLKKYFRPENRIVVFLSPEDQK